MSSLAPQADESPVQHSDRFPVAFWLIGMLLVAYVGLCTGYRDNNWGTDAWEHDRVVLALSQKFWHPGNPTYATDEPSVRYAPYTLVLALICRMSGATPHHVLSMAAVANTGLLIVAIGALLSAYDMRRIGAYAIFLMVALYGSIPGYANSLALADLPIHQLNPSAFSLPLVLLAWAIFRGCVIGESGWGTAVVLMVLTTIAILSHALTGVFGCLGLLVIVILSPRLQRRRSAVMLAAIIVGTFILCAIWPWYDFLAAVSTRRDTQYWFNPGILTKTVTTWAAPGLLLALAALRLHTYPLVRFSLVTAGLCFLLGASSFLTKSPTLARLPVPAILMLQLAVAAWMFEGRLLRPTGWLVRAKKLISQSTDHASPAALQFICIVMLLFCIVPQCKAIVSSPWLARGYVAPLLGRIDKQLNVREKFKELLKPVGPRDVVLSDIQTAWPVPSIAGRIVAALHYELYTPDQPQRERDVNKFFDAETDANRWEILDKYNVKWILLSRERLPSQVFENLLEPDALAAELDSFVLMDAARWRSAREQNKLPGLNR